MNGLNSVFLKLSWGVHFKSRVSIVCRILEYLIDLWHCLGQLFYF